MAGILDSKGILSRVPYQGIPTFWRAEYTQNLDDVDFAVYGVPNDIEIVNRPGTRYGPRAIREQSLYVGLPGVHYLMDYDLMQEYKVIDYGDIPFYPGQVEQMLANTEEAVGLMSAAGVGTLGLGGDHLVAYPAIKAHAKHHGKLSLIHFDAHTDTFEASHLNHGSMFWFGVKEGLIDPETSVQIGIRTVIPPGGDRFEILTSHQCIEIGSKAIVEKVRQVVGDRKCYISIDVDGMDPAHAPGTGTPVPGGITSAMQREILWGIHGLNVVGGDVVEVSPPYDPSHITAILGATVGMDIVYAMAAAPFRGLKRKSAGVASSA
ncbi:MAG: agmatinase [Candidatus Obscuribacter sp.]|nr:agmatinase [Candidatus Obscuribacter sp.]